MFFSGTAFNPGSRMHLMGMPSQCPLIWRDPQPFFVFHDTDIVEEYKAWCFLFGCFF